MTDHEPKVIPWDQCKPTTVPAIAPRLSGWTYWMQRVDLPMRLLNESRPESTAEQACTLTGEKP